MVDAVTARLFIIRAADEHEPVERNGVDRNALVIDRNAVRSRYQFEINHIREIDLILL